MNEAFVRSRGDGDLVLAVESFSKGTLTYKLKVKEASERWATSEPVQGYLPVGGVKYYEVDAKVGDLLRFNAETTAFDASLSFYDHRGAMLASSTDPTLINFHPSFETVIRTSGRHFVRLTSDGGGGGGSYSLNCHRATPVQIKLGVSNPIDGGSGVFEFSAAASQLVAITLYGENLTADLFNPDGSAMNGKWTNFGGVYGGVFRANASGACRMVLNAGAKSLRIDPIAK